MNDIIGVGQFGDVHIGICRLSQISKPNQTNSDNSSQIVPTDSVDSEVANIHVAVKTCKADADLATSEKFLEEACKILLNNHNFIVHLKMTPLSRCDLMIIC